MLHSGVLHNVERLRDSPCLKSVHDAQHLHENLGPSPAQPFVGAGWTEILTVWSCYDHPLKRILNAQVVKRVIIPGQDVHGCMVESLVGSDFGEQSGVVFL